MTADEVLSTMEYGDEESQDVCVIDAESRTISVPDRYATLGVESDEKGKRLCFVCPAVVGDNISLLDCSLRIIYRNGNRESAPPYLIDDAMQNGNNIEFSWLLSRKVTAYKGKVSFIFCAVKADPETGLINNEWNTTLATATVLEGLEADQHDLEESREDIITQLLAAMHDANAAAENANEAASAANTAAENAANNAESAGEAAERANTAAENANQAATNANSMPDRVTALEEKTTQLKGDLAELSVFVTPQMFGAKGDGVTDDTEAIQNALNASNLVYIPDGVYMINGTYDGYEYSYNGGIKPNTGQKIIMSQNAKLKAIANSNGFYNIVNLFQVQDVYITGGKIEGDKEYHTGTGGEHGHCIAMRACDNITIDNVECFNGWGDSIDIGKGGIDNCHNIRIYNCRSHDSRRQGISVTGVIGLVVRDCEIYNIGGTAPQFGIDIEPDDSMGVAEDIIIDSCRIIDNVGGSIVIAPVDNSIKNVRIANCITNGIIYVENSDGSIVLDNSTFEHLYIGANDVIVSNCDIESLLPKGGSGTFSNCRFKSEVSSGLIVDSLDNYPEKITEYLNFNGCTFLVAKASQYLYNGKYPSGGYVDNLLPCNLLKFMDCRIELIGDSSVLFNGRVPEELIFDGCNIVSNINQDRIIDANNVPKSTKIAIRNTKVESSVINYIIAVGNYSGYEIEIYNSKFTDFKNFLYCSSGGASGGTVRLFNNIMSNANTYNANTFAMVIANNPIKKVSELENDAGYLKSFTETDPTVPSWAKNETKPTYTASEVGALPNTTTIPTKTSQLTNDSGFLTQHQDISGKADKDSAETWTFTLADGSIVTKKVVLA